MCYQQQSSFGTRIAGNYEHIRRNRVSSMKTMDPSTTVRNISDTARWMAYFRALESQREDALFNDPYAARLAGDQGFRIANTLPDGNKHEWAWVARTYLFDQFLLSELLRDSDLVLNLAAGLDCRPYRMQLRPGLQWVEVDLPEIVSYKQEILDGETARCRLERISLDLSDETSRRSLFSELNHRARNIVVMSEGLLIYFTAEAVASLARDLAAGSHFRSWIIDLASPGQLKLLQRTTGKQLSKVGAAFKFAPPGGPGFFAPHGWKPKEIAGLLNTAAKLKRAPAELLSLLPEPQNTYENYPWTGVCLLRRT
jgi:methyltransferase (TIGR00027 family)